MNPPLVVGITGASGVVYARRLLQVLVQHRIPIHLTISPSGKAVLEHELGMGIDLNDVDLDSLVPGHDGSVIYHHYLNMMAPIASGSFPTGGMVICPCSGGTLSGVVTGASSDLIKRAADVHLKERRPLILVTRETPLSVVHLENMKRACEAGAIVLPASPGWYHGVSCLEDLIDFIVARILDQLRIEHQLMKRWGS